MSGIDVYRVQSTGRWYRRTWQAEWTPCPWCARAYTERGVRRKAARWSRQSLDWQLKNARRHTWLRVHVTRRSDPFYANLRKGGVL